MSQLDPLAKAIVRLSQQRGVTPVIVTPNHWTLRPIFFIEMAKSLQTQVDRSLRIDWCRPVPTAWSLFGDQLARRQARRINRALQRAMKSCAHDVSLQITASVARPAMSWSADRSGAFAVYAIQRDSKSQNNKNHTVKD